ncbi:unnamed protein product [Zymoseptoria tritici ST99CH_3D1]|uniref:Major facilitator superfamily transporter n=1 Tax=Zymoseptoria tritici (strain CBS 115943 / IPO323) TaxID=336722 RepID=F9X2Q1_ZYMTI|nr:putative major facilitator superfamily transporter [Zymoseptoria tritici IPO323]EGP90655.1 putative major facilitator superfamily transporter [Zymoseptoria tritici IPO323]SMR47154.1 unnamed protein product [Zymoseptoria tritici ST99CH_3D1]
MPAGTASPIASNTAPSSREQAALPEPIAYSAFTKRSAVLIVVLVSTAGFFSPFTAFVYFPAIRSIAADYGISIELMNVTVTVYLIIQGLVPPILGDLSESIGRRPVYLLVFTIYCGASIGLALQRNYAALLVLRMLQSAGSSGTIALAYGVIGDIAAPHERGAYVGLSHIGFNTAPALGPVVGGVMADKVGWPWIFVFLATFSGTLLILLVLFLDETARSIVGNGSIPPRGINKTLLQHLRNGRSPEEPRRSTFRAPNVVPCLKLIFHKNTFPVLLANATFYMMYSCLQASLAPLVQRLYGLSPLQAGLCYLSYGVAGGTASYSLGLLTDHDYRVVARQHGFSIDRVRGDDLMRFPIEEARLRSMRIYLPLCATATVGYGWSLSAHTHLAVPLVLCFIIGFTVTGVFNVCNTLIVDVHPAYPVTASASVSITRCLIAAAGVAVIELLLSEVGPGWTFTIIGALCWLMAPVLWLVHQYGWTWRKRRAGREQESAAALAAAETVVEAKV